MPAPRQVHAHQPAVQAAARGGDQGDLPAEGVAEQQDAGADLVRAAKSAKAARTRSACSSRSAPSGRCGADAP
ncbi:hypothetical protein AB0B42_10470 [Streptomyces fradiae]|uniref:hypothetical protein n=1 Tax=Streptomyces fradiae TaxID=1906 RepID=UPI0033DE138E